MSKTKLHWEDSDWLKQVSDWIHAETSRQRITIIGMIEQPIVFGEFRII